MGRMDGAISGLRARSLVTQFRQPFRNLPPPIQTVISGALAKFGAGTPFPVSSSSGLSKKILLGIGKSAGYLASDFFCTLAFLFYFPCTFMPRNMRETFFPCLFQLTEEEVARIAPSAGWPGRSRTWRRRCSRRSSRWIWKRFRKYWNIEINCVIIKCNLCRRNLAKKPTIYVYEKDINCKVAFFRF